MDEADVANVAEQMVVAVDFLHKAGFAHCDIKVGVWAVHELSTRAP